MDKARFEDQLQAHPRLAAMIAAYDEKQQELRTLKKGKSNKISRGTKKRKVREESKASDDEVYNLSRFDYCLTAGWPTLNVQVHC